MDAAVLKAGIKAAFEANMPSPTSAQTAAFDVTAGAIADAIVACVETATITYTSGLIAPSGGGPVTGVFGGSVS